MLFDEKRDYLLFKDVNLSHSSFKVVDFLKTFRPDFKFEKNEKGVYPLKFLLWGENGETRFGYIEGVICGEWNEYGNVSDLPGNDMFSEHRFVLKERQYLNNVLIITYDPRNSSRIAFSNQAAGNTVYTIYLHERILVVEALLKSSPR